MQPVPGAASIDMLARTLRARDRLDPTALVRWLEAAGYERAETIEEPGQFAVRGGIIDVFPPANLATGAGPTPTEDRAKGLGGGGSAPAPVRLDFFGDEIDRITEIDLDTMGSDRALESVELVCASLEKVFAQAEPQAQGPAGKSRRAPAKSPDGPTPPPTATIDATGGPSAVPFTDYCPRDAVAILHEPLEITEQARGYYERLTDPRIYGPPAVFKALQERFRGSGGYMEVAQFSAAGAAGDELVELPLAPLQELARDAGEAVKELGAAATGAEGRPPARVAVFCQNAGELSRLGELLDEFAPGTRDKVDAGVAYVHRGFVLESGQWPSGKVAEWQSGSATASAPDTLPLSHSATPPLQTWLVPYHELLHRFETRRRVGGGGRGGRDPGGRLRAARAMDTFLDFAPGDFVVHRDHGIAVFRGLVVMQPREVKRDAPVVLPSDKPRRKDRSRKGAPAPDPDEGLEEYLTLEFAGGSKLYVPATKIDQVQKYVGGFKGQPTLSALGGTRWKKQKEAVAESVRDLAGELLRVRAARESLPGVRYPADTAWQKEFEAEFPFTETDDQLAAVAEIKKDMTSPRPMDRLLCGDVGYGKTEVAMRAAFKACEFGKQVAVLVPTTVLAEQHERTFRSRFADYPFRVESISRFKTTKEVNDALAALRKGQVDVVIGTHRLLSKDVKFADLGLVIIDEEQRFGVEHKEKLLAFRLTADVLTLSATPIPRTLHMSMLGLRDISNLTQAPLDRRAVVTEVAPYNERRIQQAIARELARDGQVFFVHNRVHNIRSVADDIQRLAPGARIVIGHGQMPDEELEKVMMTFMNRGADILVSTTIIESGIDIPTANTMFINDADRFGLAELHQLRGRVGRYKHRAYCYLLLPADRTIGEKGVKRLKAIEEFSMLGAGFKIAMRDLEIRGAGNILGPEQSGHIAAVGYEMYCQLLDREVRTLRHEPVQVVSETSVEIGVSGMIPKRYLPSDARRMEAYRRVAVAAAPADLERIELELTQAYGGPLPASARRLLDVAALRVAASALGVRSVAVRGQDVVMRAKPADAERVAALLSAPTAGASAPAHVTVLPPKAKDDPAEVYFRPPPNYMDPTTLLRILRARLAA
jgi:transcription-repair coupling factor (superfamily II helicase)